MTKFRLRRRTDNGVALALCWGMTLLWAGLVWGWMGWGDQGVAHTVKVASDVAVTIHIEPNHNPKAGEPAQTWFLLTLIGGKPIPLQACDCRLAVYAQQGDTLEQPILRPPLMAVAAEQYQDLPGADIIFPQPGSYRLQISGAPKAEVEFQPFETSFDVTVATGQGTGATDPLVNEPVTTGTGDAEGNQGAGAWSGWMGVAIAILILVGLVSWRGRRVK